VTSYADRCSTLAQELAEPLPGTAPVAATWVALEQEGPWGHRALTDSHLDHDLGAELTARSAGTGVTVVLIRKVGHHADLPTAGAATRSVWIGHTGANSWLRYATVEDPAQLLELDFAALGAGAPPGFGAPDDSPLLLVCTNSRRDECCALIGRPLAESLAAQRPGRVWESTHLGGHRFAPVVLSLPDGFVYGGPDAGRLSLASCRGRSTLSPPAQAAELAALVASPDPRPRPLSVTPVRDDWQVVDDLEPAEAAVYRVTAVPNDPPRKESCRKGPVSSVAYSAARIDP
jgi:Sucrase/ferredoxin-like